MSAKQRMNFKDMLVLAALFSGLFSLSMTHAGTIVQCGEAVCSSDFTLQFNANNNAGGGQLLYDAVSGDISLNLDPASISGNGEVQGDTIVWTMPDSSQLEVISLSGNADPILIFGVGASTGVSGATFGFNFDLPIALQGPINADSSVSYSLTAGTAAGAQIAGIGTDKIVRAFEVDTSVGGLGSFNKDVDVGETFFFTGGPQVQNSPVYTASSQFTGDLAYDLMSVQIDFSLSANSATGLSGFVQQAVVPIPPTVWLFGSGLLGIVGIARRRRKKA